MLDVFDLETGGSELPPQDRLIQQVYRIGLHLPNADAAREHPPDSQARDRLRVSCRTISLWAKSQYSPPDVSVLMKSFPFWIQPMKKLLQRALHPNGSRKCNTREACTAENRGT